MTAETACDHPSTRLYRTRKGRLGCRTCDAEGRPPVLGATEPDDPDAVAALASQYANEAVAANPTLGLLAFRWSLDAWAQAEARRTIITDAIGPQTLIGKGRPGVLSRLVDAERAAAKGRSELGLSPDSAARIASGIRAAGVTLMSADERARYLPDQQRITR